MEIVNLIQGSPEWHAHRAKYNNASDAPVMMGVSKYKTRSQLLDERKTGIAPDVDDATQFRFDEGHRSEALARPLAEITAGSDLYPVVGINGDDSASFDGITMNEKTIFEHKMLNDEYRACQDAKELPLALLIQIEHQFMVSGAEKCIFIASKWNGDELVEKVEFIVTPDLELRKKIIAGWEQFDKDLETHVPTIKVAKVEAETVETLPVPSVVVSGSITQSNLAEITPLFDNYLSNINTSLSTDQDFADAEANAKNSRETAKRIKSLRENIIAQMADVNAVDSALKNYEDAFNKVALQLEKGVKEQKEIIKTNAVMKARQDYFAHVQSLEAEITPIRITAQAPDFAGAIKGIKTVESMQSRLNDALAAGKIEADAIARDIRAKLAWYKLNTEDYEFLFNDFNTIVYKDMDDFQMLVNLRITEHKRASAEREQAIKLTAEADARAKLEREALEAQREKEAEDQRANAKVAEASPSPAVSETVSSSPVKEVKQPQPSAHEMVLVMMDRYHVDFGTAREWLNSANFAELKVAA